MAMTESTMMSLGTQAPNFSLTSTEGDTVTIETFDRYNALVVMFICNHCPYVIHIAPTLAEVSQEFLSRNIGFVAINSNDTQAYPADNFDKMVSEKAQRNYPFPYLLDESQSVAKAYSAACTPDFYLFNKERKLVYRGQFDDSRPFRISSGNYDSTKTPASGKDLRQAIETLIAGEPPLSKQYPSLGCNIKWRPGNAPDYYG